jgi:CheY-like chemotaxis protein
VLSTVPIVGIAPEANDLAFVEFYSWGGDDLVAASDPGAIERRLRLLPRGLVQQAVAPRGTVVIADSDQNRRLVLARVLRNAGFDARFAADSVELALAATADGVVLAVAELDLPPGGAVAALRSVRERGHPMPWVLSAPPKRLGAAAAKTAGIDRVLLYDAYAPTENALFCANEALRPGFGEQRASPRLLYGTAVSFRVAGRDRDEVGYCYNLSREGLYVRTLAPLEPGAEAWIEMRPPRTDRLIRLDTKVVWRRLLGGPEGATVPPGFGLRITGGSESDWDRFRRGYDCFRSDLVAVRMSEPPPSAF